MPIIDRVELPSLVALMIFLLLLAGFVPQVYAESQGIESETFTQAQGETVLLNPPLEATVITVDQNPDRANITLFDADTGAINATGELNQGDSIDLIMEGNTVTVTYVEAVKNNEGIFLYEYPVDYEWDDTIVAYVGVIGLIVITLFLYMIYILIDLGGELR